MNDILQNIFRKNIHIGDFSKSCATVTKNMTGEEVMKLFKSDELIQGLPVIQNGIVEGLIMKEPFLLKLATPFGVSLFMKRPIEKLMERYPLVVDYYTPFNEVVKSATERAFSNIYDYILITLGGQFHGIVTVTDLLNEAIKIENKIAIGMNTYSGLPGKDMTDNYLCELIEQNSKFSVIYIRLENYEEYSINYGTECAECVVVLFSRLIERCVTNIYGTDGFVGHLYNYEFIIVVKSYNANVLKSEIKSSFDNLSKCFYDRNINKQINTVHNSSDTSYKNDSKLSFSFVAINNEMRIFKDKYHIYDRLIEESYNISKEICI